MTRWKSMPDRGTAEWQTSANQRGTSRCSRKRKSTKDCKSLRWNATLHQAKKSQTMVTKSCSMTTTMSSEVSMMDQSLSHRSPSKAGSLPKITHHLTVPHKGEDGRARLIAATTMKTPPTATIFRTMMYNNFWTWTPLNRRILMTKNSTDTWRKQSVI